MYMQWCLVRSGACDRQSRGRAGRIRLSTPMPGRCILCVVSEEVVDIRQIHGPVSTLGHLRNRHRGLVNSILCGA